MGVAGVDGLELGMQYEKLYPQARSLTSFCLSFHIGNFVKGCR